jgi:hypothetical protein
LAVERLADTAKYRQHPEAAHQHYTTQQQQNGVWKERLILAASEDPNRQDDEREPRKDRQTRDNGISWRRARPVDIGPYSLRTKPETCATKDEERKSGPDRAIATSRLEEIREHAYCCLTPALQLRARHKTGAAEQGQVTDKRRGHKWNVFFTWLSRPSAASAS